MTVNPWVLCEGAEEMPIAMTSQGRVRLLVVEDYEVLQR